MKIVSKDIGHLVYSKAPKYISEVFKKGDNTTTKASLFFSKYEVSEDLEVIATLEIIFNKKPEEEVARFSCSVVVKVHLEKEEVDKGQNIIHDIDYYSLLQAWPLFQNKISELKNLNIDYGELPPPPPKEFFDQPAAAK